MGISCRSILLPPTLDLRRGWVLQHRPSYRLSRAVPARDRVLPLAVSVSLARGNRSWTTTCLPVDLRRSLHKIKYASVDRPRDFPTLLHALCTHAHLNLTILLRCSLPNPIQFKFSDQIGSF